MKADSKKEGYPPSTLNNTSSSNPVTGYQTVEQNNDLHVHHSHQENCVTSSGSGRKIALRDFFTVLALSFHSVFEGLAIGLENHSSDVWLLFAGNYLNN